MQKNRMIYAKGILIGVLLTAMLGYIFIGQPSQAQSGKWQMEATPDGVFKMNLETGRITFYTKEQCRYGC